MTACNFINATGLTFGEITVVIRDICKAGNQAFWICRCACGAYLSTTITKLKSGHTKSCGCRRVPIVSITNRKHGLSHTHPLWHVWTGMRRRCLSETDEAYDRYGGRGITLCARWDVGEDGKHGFECFIEDMGPRPTASHSIDRKDNDAGYFPGNCRWATDKDQARNRRTSRTLYYRGHVLPAYEIAEMFGVKYSVLIDRLNAGKMTVKQAIETPVRARP